ncbi:MAG: hypothetical protein HC852_01635 [Acaryochloridaceae cyanobacterium RU_4_10]|nr:hypothetical protein [Acaryochloridaceae cyanobacterium RU_4_10]
MNQYIGDKNCAHNAHSPHLRCAINPFGPCEGCPDFRKASVGDRISRRLQIVRSCDRKRILQMGLEISLGLAGAIAVGVPTGAFIGLGWVMLSEQGQIANQLQQK